jgi:predicted nucleotidyltransferase
VPDFAFTDPERRLLQALQDRGLRFLVVGLGAALIEGAPVATLDVDLWLEGIEDARLPQASADAGGFWVSGFGVQPPAFGGAGLERLDVVLALHGLGAFDEEYARAVEREIDGLRIKVLPLDRVIVSKRATNRLKDRAALPVLEATLLARDRSGA